MVPWYRVSALLAIALAGSLIGFVLVSADAWRLSARAPIPELPPLPCNEQNWTNADRVCLTWTAPLAAAEVEALVVLGQSETVAADWTRAADAGSVPSAAGALRLSSSQATVPE